MSTNPEEQRVADRSLAEACARRGFILRYGVLGWGLGTALLWTIGMKLWMPSTPLLAILLPAALLFPAGGWVWGALVWRRMRRSPPARP